MANRNIVLNAEEEHLVALVVWAVACFQLMDRSLHLGQETELVQDISSIQAVKGHTQIRTNLVSECVLISKALVDIHLHWAGLLHQ